MQRGLLTVALCMSLTGPAYAGGVQEGLEKTGTFLAQGVVVVDKVLHWSWDTLHRYVVHPASELITLGTIELDQAA